MSAVPVSSPIYSMTGFARVSGRVSDLLSWNLSLKSVNHRFLDLHMRMPAGAESLEMRLRRLLKEKVLRGHLEVTLSVERGLRPALTLTATYCRATSLLSGSPRRRRNWRSSPI